MCGDDRKGSTGYKKKGIIYQFTPVMSSVVETSLFCHSERSEESAQSVTMAVFFAFLHFIVSGRDKVLALKSMVINHLYILRLSKFMTAKHVTS